MYFREEYSREQATPCAETCSELAGKHVSHDDAFQNSKIAVLQHCHDGISMIRGAANTKDARRARARKI